jgi:hypothetical protein
MASDLSNFLIEVDLNPIFSTVPSIIPSTAIQSPILNLFSTNTKIPEIKFLNKSCAPNATATPNNPSPAIIGPIFIPHNSKTAASPKIKIKIFRDLIIHPINSLVKTYLIHLKYKKLVQ